MIEGNEKMHNTLESNSFEEEKDFVDIFITTILYDCVLKLTDFDSGKEIIIEEPRVDVGRDSSCSLRLQESKISRLHATFIYENNVWYIKDNHSKNGTSLNGIIIEPDKKYQLMEGDIIEFAHSGKFIFYRYENNNSEPDKKKTIKEIREEDLIGHIVGGKYSLQQVIGNGGCTKVFLATDNTNKKYAIKCASKDAVGFNPVVDAFLGEVDILKRLHHTNIRGVIEQIEDEKYIFIVLDYIDGISLETALLEAGGILPEEKVIRYAIQIAEALNYAHSLNPPIVNRDIKPRNILIDDCDNVKLVDFGIAIEYNPNANDDWILGTKGYAPPEQYTGETTPKSDIYALGITMYQLLTGSNPVEMQYVALPIRQHNTSISKDLEEIVAKCVKQDPNDRYLNCLELISDLSKVQTIMEKKD